MPKKIYEKIYEKLKIYERFTEDLRKIYERFTEDLRKIYERFTKDLRKIYERFTNAKFAKKRRLESIWKSFIKHVNDCPRGYHTQCDQIWRFFGLWETF